MMSGKTFCRSSGIFLSESNYLSFRMVLTHKLIIGGINMGKLLAAVKSINITPPLGITLTGYQERDKGAAGIKDELFAKVLVLDDGQEKLVLVCTDLSG